MFSSALCSQTRAIYCNGFDQRFARQQLCKHGPKYNNRWGCVFYVVRATPYAGNGPMSMQSDTWHAFSLWSGPCNNRGAVFSVHGPCRDDVEECGNENWLDLSSEVPKFQGNSRWPEEELEDLLCAVTCAVVYRYWECVILWDFYSSCVEIRC
jgi:hypothetical protein